MRSTDALPMVGTVTTYIVSNSSSPIGGTCSRPAAPATISGTVLLCPTTSAQPAAVLARAHVPRELGGRSSPSTTSGLMPSRCATPRRSAACDACRSRKSSARRPNASRVAEHLRQPRGAQLALRRQRRVGDGAELLLGMPHEHDGRGRGRVPVHERRASTAKPPKANNQSGARNVLRRRVSDGETGGGSKRGVHGGAMISRFAGHSRA